MVCAGDVPSGESILWLSSGSIVAKGLLNSFESSVGLVIDTPFNSRDVNALFPDLREVTILIVCQVFLESPEYWLKLF